MDAANSLGRWLLLAAGLSALVGCQSDGGLQARGQLPSDPLPPGVPAQWGPPGTGAVPGAPVAPLPASAPPAGPGEPTGPLPPAPPPDLGGQPNSPIAPIGPIPPPGGVVPASPGAPVVGQPVPPGVRGGPVIPTGYVGTKSPTASAELLRTREPRIKVVAIVGANNVITDQEVREAVWQQYDEIARLDGAERQAKEKELYTLALRKTIERELILDEMYTKLKKVNKVSEMDKIREYAGQMADKQLREFRKRAGVKSEAEFAALLGLQGLTLPVVRRQLERQIMADQYVSTVLKDNGRRVGMAEVRAYYDAHPQQFQAPDRVKWQHIFINFNKHATPQAAQAHAEMIRQKAAAGADFAALSKEYDNGYAGQQNGFGTGEKRDEISPADLAPTVWELKPGELSAVIQTPTGYHIVKVVERDYAGVRPFDAKVQADIREKLNREMLDAKYKELVEELWRKGVVRVFDSQ